MHGCRRLNAAVMTVLVGSSMIGAALVADAPNAAAVTSGTITTIVGTGVAGSGGDGGPATAATISTPFATAYDSAGNLYVSDYTAENVRKIAPDGTITRFAGDGTGAYSGDNGPATLAGIDPRGIAVDSSDNVYINDWANARIRKVAPDGTITTIAGDGTVADTGDGGLATAAQITNSLSIAVDAAGDILFAEPYSGLIRKIAADGTMSTIAGGGSSGLGDGGLATAATLSFPVGVTLDAAQNVYIADANDNAVRRIDATTGIITSVVGNGTASSTGDGGPAIAATVNRPFGVVFDRAGELFITENVGSFVRKVDAAGNISTVAGTGTDGYNGDDQPATAAQLDSPNLPAIDSHANLVVPDGLGSRVRSIAAIVPAPTPTPTPTPLATPALQGYLLAASDGGVFAHGNAVFRGSEGGLKLAQPIVTMASTPDHGGYWLFASDGGVFAHGDAGFFGSEGGLKLTRPIVAAATTPSGNGYWLFASDGGVFTHGDAKFYGSEGELKLTKPIVAAATTPSGDGYWLFASDGGVFTHGDAAYFGSEGATALQQPIVAAATTPSGDGYWLFASDGGVFTHGDATFHGSEGALKLVKPIVAAAATSSGNGYWLFASDGGVFTHGDAGFYGSQGDTPLVKPIVAATQS